MQAQVAWKVLIMLLVGLATCLVLPLTNVIADRLDSGCDNTIEAWPFNGPHCMTVLSATQAVDSTGADLSHDPLASTMVIQVGKI